MIFFVLASYEGYFAVFYDDSQGKMRLFLVLQCLVGKRKAAIETGNARKTGGDDVVFYIGKLRQPQVVAKQMGQF